MSKKLLSLTLAILSMQAASYIFSASAITLSEKESGLAEQVRTVAAAPGAVSEARINSPDCSVQTGRGDGDGVKPPCL